MAHIGDEWIAESTEAFELSLVRPTAKGLQTLSTFNPEFTYPIFGEEERIFGYQGLKIKLRYNASDMRPNLLISQQKKYKVIGETEPTDIQALIKPFLPEVAFQKTKEFEAALQALPKDWTPPGERIKELQSKDGQYEIWKGTLADPAMLQLLNRIKILAPIFIEGGILIETDKGEALDRWTIFLLYRKHPAVPGQSEHPSYEFAGFVTAYRFFVFISPAKTATMTEDSGIPSGDFDLEELPCRSRISQFVILPPHQKKGLASQLYSVIYQHYLHHPQTYEITVEDPNEAFDDLRDLADLAYLRTVEAFKSLRIDTTLPIVKKGKVPTILDPAQLESIREKAKMSPRQFSRVVEMHLMAHIAEPLRPSLEETKGKQSATKEQEKEYNLWQLFVKQRLYRRNKDQLLSIEDRGERVQKLNEALGSIELEYARILAAFESRQKFATQLGSGKRKAVDEDDSAALPSSKKARV